MHLQSQGENGVIIQIPKNKNMFPLIKQVGLFQKKNYFYVLFLVNHIIVHISAFTWCVLLKSLRTVVCWKIPHFLRPRSVKAGWW